MMIVYVAVVSLIYYRKTITPVSPYVFFLGFFYILYSQFAFFSVIQFLAKFKFIKHITHTCDSLSN